MANSTKEIDDKNRSMEIRYQRAQTLMQGIWTKNNIALNATILPHWIENTSCFWYEKNHHVGKEYRLVNADTSSNELAFDHAALANALSKVTKENVSAKDLPIRKITIALSPLTVSFAAFNKCWSFDGEHCEEIDITPRNWVISPDGKLAAIARNHNLWLRDLTSGEEYALTEDGESRFAYAAPGSAWGYPTGAGMQVLWSPDSKQLFTVQHDTRKLKTTPYVTHVPPDGNLRPTVIERPVAYPGDDNIEEYRLLTIDVKSGIICDAHYQRVPVSRNSWGFFNAHLGWWATNSQRAYFVDQERGDKAIRVVEFDIHTGATKILFEETSETQINISANSEDYPPFFVIPESNELIWWSERSGWAHLYLYDLETGILKHAVTEGNWQVRDVIHFDAERREVYVQTAGRVENRDPYYRDLCRIHIDTGEITTMISSDHEIGVITSKGLTGMLMENMLGSDIGITGGISHNGNFAVITRSRADQVPVSLLIDRQGDEILEIETADISDLPDNWQWPEPVKLLAADDSTDIYGLVFRPSDFSPDKSYPIVSHVFKTPELPWVAKGSFSNGLQFLGCSYFDAAALAELGFIVVQIDGRGSPYRHKAFHDECYGWVESACNLDDHVAGIQQLAKRYPYMDLNRVGITCHLSGGPGGVQALLQHPDFYKVGVNGWLHDSRLMPGPMWGDKYEGLSGPTADHQYPTQLVNNLKGKLLLMHGMLDISCPVAGTFRVVEALQKANKDFDMLILPNLSHAPSNYLIRRAWDYLVRHLLETEPPKEFRLSTYAGGDQFQFTAYSD